MSNYLCRLLTQNIAEAAAGLQQLAARPRASSLKIAHIYYLSVRSKHKHGRGGFSRQGFPTLRLGLRVPVKKNENWSQNLDSVGYRVVECVWSYDHKFWLNTSVWQTDRQTPPMAERDKNFNHNTAGKIHDCMVNKDSQSGFPLFNLHRLRHGWRNLSGVVVDTSYHRNGSSLNELNHNLHNVKKFACINFNECCEFVKFAKWNIPPNLASIDHTLRLPVQFICVMARPCHKRLPLGRRLHPLP